MLKTGNCLDHDIVIRRLCAARLRADVVEKGAANDIATGMVAKQEYRFAEARIGRVQVRFHRRWDEVPPGSELVGEFV
jgi:hypothetical protein